MPERMMKLWLVSLFSVVATAVRGSTTSSNDAFLWFPLQNAHSTQRRAVFFIEAGADCPVTGRRGCHANLRILANTDLDHSGIRVHINGRVATTINEIRSAVVPHTLELRRGMNTVTYSWTHADQMNDISSTIQGVHVAGGSLTTTVSTNRGGNVGYQATQEAEDADCTGVVIGPTYESYSETPYLPSEASQRKACQLQKAGDSTQFKSTMNFNAFVLRYSIPDAPSGGGYVTTAEVSVNDVFMKEIELTSEYGWFYGSYPFSNTPSQGKAHHFYDDVRVLFNKTFPPGTTVRVAMTTKTPTQRRHAITGQVVPDEGGVAVATTTTAPNGTAQCNLPLQDRHDCGFDGITPEQCTQQRKCCYQADPVPNPRHYPYCFHPASGPVPPPSPPPGPPPGPPPAPPAPPNVGVTLDLMDFYDVPAPYAQPSNSVSVIAFGADPTGKKDSLSAFTTALQAAGKNGTDVWIPAGNYTVNGHVQLVDHVQLFGAGPWHSVLHGTGEMSGQGAIGFYASNAPQGTTGVGLFDFAIVGDVRERIDSQPVNGIGGAPTGGSTIQNLWIQHTKCGIWVDGPANDLVVVSNSIQDTTADGTNLHIGWTNVTIKGNFYRNTGDDSIALWSDRIADSNVMISGNTIQIPVLANGIALYGGHDNTVVDNTVSDTISSGGGIHVGNRFNSVPLAGVTTIHRNRVVRGGCLDPNWRFGVGALWFYALDGSGSMTGNISVTDCVIEDSPFNTLLFIGDTITGVSLHNITVTNSNGASTMPYFLQMRGTHGNLKGSAEFSDVHVTGFTPGRYIYNCGGTEAKFGILDRGGNGDWLVQCDSEMGGGALASCPSNTTCQGPPGNQVCAHCSS
eukprot:m.398615 g.398615  ORF g.398615 m.398615 type:complete len:851 (+) comp21138_c0_seq1:96-2648(+)